MFKLRFLQLARTLATTATLAAVGLCLAGNAFADGKGRGGKSFSGSAKSFSGSAKSFSGVQLGSGQGGGGQNNGGSSSSIQSLNKSGGLSGKSFGQGNGNSQSGAVKLPKNNAIGNLQLDAKKVERAGNGQGNSNFGNIKVLDGKKLTDRVGNSNNGNGNSNSGQGNRVPSGINNGIKSGIKLDGNKLTDRIGNAGGNQNNLGKNTTKDLPKFDLSNISRIGKNGQVKDGNKNIQIGKIADLAKGGKFDQLINTQTGKKLDLKKQFDLAKTGDVARRLNLVDQLKHGKGVQGLVKKDFCDKSFSCWYSGPKCFNTFCWTPKWCNWVDWCWWDHCHDHCDPRPIFCKPCHYDPCDHWTFWHCPQWVDLHGCYCGTWVDCPPVIVEVGMDLQLLAVRFVDAGHPEQQLGPRYRAWVRNNSPARLVVPFNLIMIASNGPQLQPGLPEAGVRIPVMEPGQIIPVDIRLPYEASLMGMTPEGQRVPFSHLTTIVDAHREVVEVFEENNGSSLVRGDVLPVDPTAFAAEVEAAAIGAPVSVAGEGFGPEPGQVIVTVNGMELQGVIEGWYDLGVRFQVPNLPLAAPAEAQVVIVRRDGAAANPVLMTLVPAAMASAIQPAPLPSP